MHFPTSVQPTRGSVVAEIDGDVVGRMSCGFPDERKQTIVAFLDDRHLAVHKGGFRPKSGEIHEGFEHRLIIADGLFKLDVNSIGVIGDWQPRICRFREASEGAIMPLEGEEELWACKGEIFFDKKLNQQCLQIKRTRLTCQGL